jgi:hypothetical protein
MVFLSAVNTQEHILKQIIIIPSSNTLFNSPFNITLLLNTTQPTPRKNAADVVDLFERSPNAGF